VEEASLKAKVQKSLEKIEEDFVKARANKV
jgi:hypothetical protein